MTEEKKPVSFLMAMLSEFKKPGQTTQDFANEIKALSEADKAWYRQAFIEHGYNFI